MRNASRGFIAAIFIATGSVSFGATDAAGDGRTAMQALDWKRGPTTGALGDKSTIALPEGAMLLEEKDGSKFLELTGNLPSPGNSIVAGKTWWAVFHFSSVGYVKDDEKIDADALLKDLKAQDGPGNEERRKRGMAELFTDGWHVPPHYDTQTKHLEWALKLRASDSAAPIVNYTVRLLGRTGYESAVLVSNPETLDTDVKAFKTVLTGFNFKDGERYSEFKQGDRVAEFGLAALVAGGAAAVVAKTGFWKVIVGFLAAFWKLIAVGVVAAFAAIGKLFGRKST